MEKSFITRTNDEQSMNNKRTELSRRRLVVASASAVLAIGAGGGAVATASGAEKPDARQVTVAYAPSASSGVLPPDWPQTRGLPSKACRPGDPIDRQVPQRIDSAVAAIIDSRCEPPRSQPYTNVRTEPSRTSPIVARAYDGETVRLECRTTGQALGDDRDPHYKESTWLFVTFEDYDRSNQQRQGFVAAANMGQLVVDSAVPKCDIRRPVLPESTPTAPALEPTLTPTAPASPSANTTRIPVPTTTMSPTTTPVPTVTYTRSPIPTTTPSRTQVPVPTTTMSPTKIP